MNCIELRPEQVDRSGKFAIPLVEGYNSLYHHPLTQHGTRGEREKWGYDLTVICEENGIEYYCFDYNDDKINVYPNDLIEELLGDHQ